MKISVVLTLRDGADYIRYLNAAFAVIEKAAQAAADLTLEYFIYENNSRDDTKAALAEFFDEGRAGRYWSEDLAQAPIEWGWTVSADRGKYMSKLRNGLKERHGLLDSDYTLLLDCDVVFPPDIFTQLLPFFAEQKEKEVGAVTPYDAASDMLWRKEKGRHYYDSLAFITKEGIDFRDNNNTCMFRGCTYCRHRRGSSSIQEEHLLPEDEPSEVQSAFGGFFLVRTDVYNAVSGWGNTTLEGEEEMCEHHSFCARIRELGKSIWIDPRVQVMTSSRGNYAQHQELLVL